MADDKPKMVTVTALEAHTAFGKSYEVGDSYDIDEQYMDSLVVQGKAAPADPAGHAKRKAKGEYRTAEMKPAKAARKAAKKSRPR